MPAGLWHKSLSAAHVRLCSLDGLARRAPNNLDSMAKKAQRYFNRLGLHFERARQRLRQSGFSNFDEEPMLAEFVARLVPDASGRTAVDIGAGDGIRGSNTYALFRRGWRGVGFEGDERRARRLARAYKNFEGVEARRALVTPSNVIELLREQGVPDDFGVLSLDIDSYDYFVLDAILRSFRPRVVVTEINEKIPPPVRFVVRYDANFRLQHHFFGYSIASLEELCARHAYALVAVEYNNAFVIPRELLGAEPALDAATAYRRGYLERPDRRERFPRNQDMESLHSMSPAQAVAFLKNFFARHEGKYDLSLAETPEPAEAAHT
ncbi:MAG: hypothetical protein QOE46_132 [Acidobacteriota bacterium]|nr:hypothetical protein [Acidobacteriota bacterium]